jgi:hypothetical protein
MSRFVLLARSARAVEARSIEASPKPAVPGHPGRPVARLGMTEDPTCWSVHAAHGALPTRTALWFWAVSTSRE